jgi:preprotein translocase subunit SecD
MTRANVMVAIALIGLAVLGTVGCGPEERGVALEIRHVDPEPGPGLTEMVFSGWGHADTFYVADEVLLSSADVDSATVVGWGEGHAVEILLTSAGRERFAEVSAGHIGDHLGILVDGRLVAAPIVRDTIAGGRALINGDFSEEEAERIAAGLRSR